MSSLKYCPHNATRLTTRKNIFSLRLTPSLAFILAAMQIRDVMKQMLV